MTATCDVVDQHGDRAAVLDVPLRDVGGVRAFEGRIATIRCHEDNTLLRSVVGEPGDGRVLVVDGGGSLRVALLGDNIATIALEHGWAGLVLYAAVRDVAELRGLRIGLKALGTCPRASRKLGGGERDEPVRFGGVTFRPGALLFADEDGVVVVNDEP